MSADERRTQLALEATQVLEELDAIISRLNGTPDSNTIYHYNGKVLQFKKYFRELTDLPNAHYAAEDILTRFSQTQLRWNKLVSPDSYIYSVS